MRVMLIAQTGLFDFVPGYVWSPDDNPRDADEIAEMGGRLCYTSWNRPNPATATNRGYLKNIIDSGHFSVLEHASATFYIDGVSRNFTHELIRHRHLSFSEVSQRYVDVSDYEVVIPPVERTDPTVTTRRLPEKVRKAYLRVVERLATTPGVGRKGARQAARYGLPSGLETKILVTGNHRAWRDVLIKRLAVDDNLKPLADLEFYEVATKLLYHLKKIAPNTYQDFE